MPQTTNLQKGDCFSFRLSNGYYGAAVVLELGFYSGNTEPRVLIAITSIYQTASPTPDEIAASNLLVANFLDYNDLQIAHFSLEDLTGAENISLSLIGKLPVAANYPNFEDFCFSGSWDFIPSDLMGQKEWELDSKPPITEISIQQLLTKGL